jgi:hypothetical protein
MDEQEEEFRERTRKLIHIFNNHLHREAVSVGMSAMQTLLLVTAIKFNIDKQEFLEQMSQHWDETEKFEYQLQFEQFMNGFTEKVKRKILEN